MTSNTSATVGEKVPEHLPYGDPRDEPLFNGGRIDAADYLSPDFFRLENEKLWPRAWQIACRAEELQQVGDYVTYDILDESIIVLRAPGGIRAFYNVCQHRGRQLTEGCGHLQKLQCRYHGWQWDLDGNNTGVVDLEDWQCKMSQAELALPEVRVGLWGGWVFINMDEQAVSLEQWLEPAKSVLDPLELEAQRYYWRKSTVIPCNWKVTLEAFSEAYHVQTTHRHMLPTYKDDRSTAYAYGNHGMFGSYYADRPLGAGSPRVGPPNADVRKMLYKHMTAMKRDLNAGSASRGADAAEHVYNTLPADASAREVAAAFRDAMRVVNEKSGGGYPNITPEQIKRVGQSWHIFPNLVMLPTPIGTLFYRSRPCRDQDHCIFEVHALERYEPGTEPETELELVEDFRDYDAFRLILSQDFSNIPYVQKGMKSRGFNKARCNPLQEVAVSNFHRALYEFLEIPGTRSR